MPAITLAQAAAALHSKLKTLSSEVRQTAVDESADGYGPDIDDALRRMQFDSVVSLDSYIEIAAFLILARYYALVRFSSLISSRVDTEGYAVEGDRNTIFDNIMELREAAAREAATYGFIVETSSDSQTGSANQPIDQATAASAWARGNLPTDYLDVTIDPLYFMTS